MASPWQLLTSPNVTPFVITVQDAILLEDSEGFAILRAHLAEECSHGFCSSHDTTGQEQQQAWIGMRDVLHALLAPIVALKDHAASVAAKSLKSTCSESLEYAFSGDARNAFVWLHAFLATDEDWCLSKACPACIVSDSVDAEYQLRLILASCLLSDARSGTETGRPALPPFGFFGKSVRQALEDDDLWGQQFYDTLEPKARNLQRGMRVLMKQCRKIELGMSPPVTPALDDLDTFEFFSQAQPVSAGMPLQRSKMARKQVMMMKEEEKWLRIAEQCWESLKPGNFVQPDKTDVICRMSSVGGP